MIPAPEPHRRAGAVDEDAVEVVTAAGAVLRIDPATATPADVLAGRASAYALAAWALRDVFVRAGRPGYPDQPPAEQVATCAVLALRHAYPTAQPADVDAWLGTGEQTDGIATVRIAMAACGLIPTPRAAIRTRALRLAAAGLGAVALTAAEASPLEDAAINAGRSLT